MSETSKLRTSKSAPSQALGSNEIAAPAEQIVKACKSGSLGVVQGCLMKDRTLLQVKDTKGRNLLMVAARFGNAQVVRFLSDYGVDIHEEINGNTALSLAIHHGKRKCVAVILRSMEGQAARALLGRTTSDLEEKYKSIHSLDLSGCHLYSLPTAVMAYLTSIEKLDLSGNELDTLPSNLERLGRLKYISLIGNCFEDLPVALANVSTLKRVRLDGNPLSRLPPTLAWKVVQKGSDVALQYMRRRAASLVWIQLKLALVSRDPELATQFQNIVCKSKGHAHSSAAAALSAKSGSLAITSTMTGSKTGDTISSRNSMTHSGGRRGSKSMSDSGSRMDKSDGDDKLMMLASLANSAGNSNHGVSLQGLTHYCNMSHWAFSDSLSFSVLRFSSPTEFGVLERILISNRMILIILFNLDFQGGNEDVDEIKYWIRQIRTLATRELRFVLVGIHKRSKSEPVSERLAYLQDIFDYESYPEISGICSLTKSSKASKELSLIRHSLLDASSFLRFNRIQHEELFITVQCDIASLGQEPALETLPVIMFSEFQKIVDRTGAPANFQFKFLHVLVENGALLRLSNTNSDTNCFLVLVPSFITQLVSVFLTATSNDEIAPSGMLSMDNLSKALPGYSASLHIALLALLQCMDIARPWSKHPRRTKKLFTSTSDSARAHLEAALDFEPHHIEMILIPSHFRKNRPNEKVRAIWQDLQSSTHFRFTRIYHFPNMPIGFFGRLLFRLAFASHFELDLRRSWKHGALLRRGGEFALLEFDSKTHRIRIEVRTPTQKLRVEEGRDIQRVRRHSLPGDSKKEVSKKKSRTLSVEKKSSKSKRRDSSSSRTRTESTGSNNSDTMSSSPASSTLSDQLGQAKGFASFLAEPMSADLLGKPVLPDVSELKNLLIGYVIDILERLIGEYSNHVQLTVERFIQCPHCWSSLDKYSEPYLFTYEECIEALRDGCPIVYCCGIKSRGIRVHSVVPELSLQTYLPAEPIRVIDNMGSDSLGTNFRGVLLPPSADAGSEVIIKELCFGTNLQDDSEDAFLSLAELQRDSQLLTNLTHPNLAKFYGLHTEPLRSVFELIPGLNLRELLAIPASKKNKGQLKDVKLIEGVDPEAASRAASRRKKRREGKKNLAVTEKPNFRLSEGIGEISWPVRMKVLYDIAQGLLHLHSMTPPIVHGNLTPDTIRLVVHGGHESWKQSRGARIIGRKKNVSSDEALYGDGMGDSDASSASEKDTSCNEKGDLGMFKAQELEHAQLLETLLLDYGFGYYALRLHTEKKLSQNWQWMAPELLKSDGKCSPAADVYAFGMLMYLVLTQQMPFADSELSSSEKLLASLEQGVRPHFPADAPKVYVDLMKMCWETQMEKRPLINHVVDKLVEITEANDMSSIRSIRQSLGMSRLLKLSSSTLDRYPNVDRKNASSSAMFNASRTKRVDVGHPVLLSVYVPELRQVWLGSADGAISFLNIGNWEITKTIQAHQTRVYDILVVRNRIWTCSESGEIIVRDSQNPENIITKFVAHNGRMIKSMCWCLCTVGEDIPTVQSRVWSCSPVDQTVCAWNTTDHSLAVVFGVNEPPTNLHCSGTLVWVATQNSFLGFDGRSFMKTLVISNSHRGLINDMVSTFDPVDGHLNSLEETRLWTAGTDKELKVWNTNTGERCAVLHGATSKITCLEVVGDSVWSGDFDGNILLYDSKAYEPVQELNAKHEEAVRGITWIYHENHGRFVLSGSRDGILNVWCLQRSPLSVRASLRMEGRQRLLAARSSYELRYQKLIDLFSEPPFHLYKVFSESVSVNEMDSLVPPLLHLLKASGSILNVLQYAIETEVEHCVDESQLFRGENINICMLTRFLLDTGYEFLHMTLVPLFLSMIEYSTDEDGQSVSFEVDPARLSKDADIDRHRRRIIRWARSFLESIVVRAQSLPPALKFICTYVQKVVRQKFPKTTFTSVGGILFLRLICPAIVSPERVGLKAELAPPRNVRRGLILAAKLLQNLSNDVLFDDSKETYMAPFSSFIETYRPHIVELTKVIINPSLVSPSSISTLQLRLQQECNVGHAATQRNPQSYARLHAYMVKYCTLFSITLREKSKNTSKSGESERISVARRLSKVIRKLGVPDTYSDCDRMTISEFENIVSKLKTLHGNKEFSSFQLLDWILINVKQCESRDDGILVANKLVYLGFIEPGAGFSYEGLERFDEHSDIMYQITDREDSKYSYLLNYVSEMQVKASGSLEVTSSKSASILGVSQSALKPSPSYTQNSVLATSLSIDSVSEYGRRSSVTSVPSVPSLYARRASVDVVGSGRSEGSAYQSPSIGALPAELLANLAALVRSVNGKNSSAAAAANSPRVDIVNLDGDLVTEIRQLDGYKYFQRYVCLLAAVDPRSLDSIHQLAFWLNVGNLLSMHAFIELLDPKGKYNVKPSSAIRKVRSFCYMIGNSIISLREIQNHIFAAESGSRRLNKKKHPYSIANVDGHASLAIMNGTPVSAPPMIYLPETVLGQLHDAVACLVTSSIVLKKKGSQLEVQIPKDFEKFCQKGISDRKSSSNNIITQVIKYVSPSQRTEIESFGRKVKIRTLRRSDTNQVSFSLDKLSMMVGLVASTAK